MAKALVFILCFALVGGPASEAVAQPSPTASPAPGGLPTTQPRSSIGSNENQVGWFDVEGRVRGAISQWFADLVASAIEPVFKLLGQTVLSTPRIDHNDRINDLWRFSLGIADAALILFVLAGAGIVTINSGLGAQLTAKEALPRFLAAAAVANLSMVLLTQMIDLSNALSRGVMGSMDARTISAGMADKLFNGSLSNPFLALLALFVIVLAILVAVAYVIRVAILVVLAAAAPLLLITYSLPQSDNWARIWWRAALALLSVPVAQSFLIVVGFQVFLSGDGLLGLSSGGLVDLLVIGCILYMLFKIPFWALDTALGGAGSSALRKAKHLAVNAAKAAAV